MIKSILKTILNARANLQRKVIISWSNNMKNCSIDKRTIVGKNSSFYKVEIRYGTYLSKNAHISNTIIGKFCSIGPNLVCGFGIHPINGISTSPAFYSTAKQNGFTFSNNDKIKECEVITIGNDVFIGANVTILDGVSIGDGAVIGAGAVVSKSIPPYAVAIGCPIKVVKMRFGPDIIKKLLLIKWWDKDQNVLRKVATDFYDIENFIEQHKHD